MEYQELDFSKVLNNQPKFYLHEQAPHIVFTPYLKSLAKEIIKDETNNLIKAKLIYEYITTHITYSFVRNYYTIPIETCPIMITNIIRSNIKTCLPSCRYPRNY